MARCGKVKHVLSAVFSSPPLLGYHRRPDVRRLEALLIGEAYTARSFLSSIFLEPNVRRKYVTKGHARAIEALPEKKEPRSLRVSGAGRKKHDEYGLSYWKCARDTLNERKRGHK
jgi:hypothetical protein